MIKVRFAGNRRMEALLAPGHEVWDEGANNDMHGFRRYDGLVDIYSWLLLASWDTIIFVYIFYLCYMKS